MVDNRKAPRGDVRSECYDMIRGCVEQNMREYYKQHPERLLDQRSVEKIEMMRQTLACILEVLDGYELTKVEGE
jgi:hypothetical protein